ncbi:MAG: carboxypeptidase regulatory-like domain-containing protein [Burkholderiales bacterium]|nr:MAG: carboxypeptidase regulatory-like domain-containing protein [Burkholderiales bacterium]
MQTSKPVRTPSPHRSLLRTSPSRTSPLRATPLLVALLLSACGGGGTDATPSAPAAAPAAAPAPSTALTLSGTAAIGAPLPDATVTLRDAGGRVLTTTTDAAGRFEFTGLAADARVLQLSASAQLGQRQVVHYALLPGLAASGTANVTPLTTAVTALAGPTSLPADLDAAQLAALSTDTVRRAAEQVEFALAPLAAKLVPGGFDPLSTAFEANGRGADLLLDHIELTVRDDAVYIANKMTVGGADDEATTGGTARIPRSAGTAAKSAVRAGKAASDGVTQVSDTATTTEGFDDLVARFTECFRVPADQRLTNRTQTLATVHPACAGLALPGYQHNGTDFAVRWARALNSATLDTRAGATFLRPEVRLRVATSPERIAVNINFRDIDGNGYTTPEIIERQADGTWMLYGNRRSAAGYVEATLSHRTDLTRAPVFPTWGTAYNNVNISQIEAGFRLSFDPRLSFGADGSVQYPVTDLTTATGYGGADRTYAAIAAAAQLAGRTSVRCVVVTGPGRFDASGTKWMGFFPHGLVLKRPASSATQDYLAIDARLSQAARQALDSKSIGDTVVEAGNGSANSGFCGNGVTTSSSPNYTVEVEALRNQVNPLTGAVDPSIDGRDVAWNTGPRYARIKPDAAMIETLSSNPLVTFHVIDTAGVLRMRFGTRFLGELPPVSTMRDLVAYRKVSQLDRATLARYLDFDSGTAEVTTDVTRVNAAWTTEPNAFGADGIGFYSEVYRSVPGRGLSGPLSGWAENQANGRTSGLWASDADLAGTLDTAAGTNFYWWNAGFANEPGGADCSTLGSVMVSNTTLGAGRGTRALEDRALGSSTRLLGTGALSRACLGNGGGAGTHAALDRELWTRTYTDKNVRVYVYVQNKTFR